MKDTPGRTYLIPIVSFVTTAVLAGIVAVAFLFGVPLLLVFGLSGSVWSGYQFVRLLDQRYEDRGR